MIPTLLLGLDDTDVLGHHPGTGRLARDLGAHLESRGLARLGGVVRHQLLVDPRIPYTSHNSPACLMLAAGGNGAAGRIFDEAKEYVAGRAAQGSDPGLCMARTHDVEAEVVRFGGRAGSEVLDKSEAIAVAGRCGLRLEELGGTGDGIIGALAAVGLTAGGNAGRFLELAGGLRDLGDLVPVALLHQRGITLVSISRDGEAVPEDAAIAGGEWIRPRLIGGRPVLLVEHGESGWHCFDRKKRHEHSGGEPTA